MNSFAVGTVLSLALAGVMLWAMLEGTVTMVERSDSVSTLTQDIWHDTTSPAGMEAPEQPGS